MIPVLQPSMFAGYRTIQHQQQLFDDDDDDDDDDVDVDDNSNSNSNSNNKQKNETTNVAKKSNGKPIILALIQSRLRSYYISYHRHRYFRRSLLLLWAIAVFVMTCSLWFAWSGESVMETLAITTTPPVDICFVTAQYASSMEQTDRLVNLRKESPKFFTDERNKSYFHFFAFTNRRDWIEKTTTTTEETTSNKKTTTTKTKDDGNDGADNGWTILLKEFPPETFQRFITQSRWPKFQGFRHETIQKKCDVVFYMDGTVLPKGSPWKFQREARRILDSEVQLSQELHPHAKKDGGGIAGEMERCRLKNKDIETNLQATKEWFQAQPDFINDCVLYQNTFFGYAVTSPSFRTAADFAWGRFSLEQDSWRDQPLWCYTLHHFGIQPLIIPSTLFLYQKDRKRGNKHTYGIDAATNAQQYYDNNKNNNNNQRNNDVDNKNDKNNQDLVAK
jgi:hypothetical protein